ncbi:MAG: hypothetical protein JNL83_35000 [Myxococcales bacterium]|nr:hypothetical protein [Myxococcales bacterium]
MNIGSSAAAPAGYLGARAIVTPVAWLYVGLEAGVIASGTLDLPDDMQLRGGLARLFAGLSL